MWRLRQKLSADREEGRGKREEEPAFGILDIGGVCAENGSKIEMGDEGHGPSAFRFGGVRSNPVRKMEMREKRMRFA